jgi:Radical SAM superfamily
MPRKRNDSLDGGGVTIVVENASSRAEDGLTFQLRKQLEDFDRPEHRRLHALTLLLTWRCPAACDHCVFESSPHNSITLDPEVARRTVEAVARQSPPPILSFSGGEPFLLLPLMRELAAFGLSRGMVSEVVTSAAWVADVQRSAAILADLQKRGLRSLCISYDRFHAPFVKPWKVQTAILAGLELGLRVVLNTMVDRDDTDCVDLLAGMIELPRETIARCFVNRLATVPVGRARQNVDQYIYTATPPSGGCPFPTQVVTLSPRGLLYPCCGSVVGEPVDKAGLFIQDDLAGRTVEEIETIIAALRDDVFFRLLQAIGPYGLLQELRRRNPNLSARTQFTGQCDACLEFTDNADVADAARRFLRQIADKLGEAPAEATH